MYLSDLLTIPPNMAGLPGPLDPVRPLGGAAGRPAAHRPAVLGEHALPRRPRARARARLRLRPGAAGRAELGSRHRAGDPRPAEDADEDVLPLRERLGRGAEHAHVPGLPRPPGHAARPERPGDRVDGQARPRARLRDRPARALPPQELLLSRPAEGLPDLPVRRPALRPAAVRRPGPGRRPRDRDRARAPRGGRRQDDPRRRRRRAHPRRRVLARRLQPRRHAARRDRDAAGRALARGGAALPAAPAPDGRRARHLRRRDGEGLAPLRRQRLRARGRGGAASARRPSSRT